MLVLGRIRRWMLGNVCRKRISRGGFFGLGCLFFSTKDLEIFTGFDDDDDDVFVEVPK